MTLGNPHAKVTYGIFGKLPAKRDFVAVGLAQAVLSPWEAWLQRAIAQSRQTLDRDWVRAFLSAPIWRFWCGAKVLGREAIGVMMPSVDGAGRYFPLTVLALATEGRSFMPPGDSASEAALAALETLCLSVLEPGASYDAFLAALHALPMPPTRDVPPAEPAAFISPGGAEGGAPDAFMTGQMPRLLVSETRRAEASASRWWTSGGEDYPPRLIGMAGLPTDETFSAMLSGRFDPAGTLS